MPPATLLLGLYNKKVLLTKVWPVNGQGTNAGPNF